MSSERTRVALSVILPVYNAMPWLTVALRDMLKQQLPGGASLEVLAAFDGGDDGSLGFLLALALPAGGGAQFTTAGARAAGGGASAAAASSGADAGSARAGGFGGAPPSSSAALSPERRSTQAAAG